MPRKVPLTSKQIRAKKIREYKKGFKCLTLDIKKTLLAIERNQFGQMEVNDPLYEAAKTYSAWKDEGTI